MAGRSSSARFPGLITFALLAVYVSSCSDSVQYEEPVKHPLKTLFHTGDSLVVTIADDVHLNELVDLSVFGSLRPGMTAEMAKAVAGEPELGKTSDGDIVYRWRTVKGVVEVSQEQADDSVDPAIKVWRLRATPSRQHSSAILDRRIIAVLNPRLESVTVNSATEGVVCKLGPGGSVVTARWRRLSQAYE